MVEQSIDKLRLDNKINKLLKHNKIETIKQLTTKTKTNLKNIGLESYQISELQIKLQLEGYDLK